MNDYYVDKIKVQIDHCDSYKIVHNSNYFVWFDMCVFNKVMEGREVSDLKKKPYKIIKSRCRYVHAATYSDNLLIKTRFILKNSLVDVKQYMFNEDTNQLVSICNSLIEINLEGALFSNESSFIK